MINKFLEKLLSREKVRFWTFECSNTHEKLPIYRSEYCINVSNCVSIFNRNLNENESTNSVPFEPCAVLTCVVQNKGITLRLEWLVWRFLFLPFYTVHHCLQHIARNTGISSSAMLQMEVDPDPNPGILACNCRDGNMATILWSRIIWVTLSP